MKTTPEIIIFSLMVLILLNSAYALPCQYIVNNTYSKEVQNVYEKGTDRFITDSLELTNFVNGGDYGSFEIHNNFDQPVSIRIIFDYGYTQTVFGRWKRATVDFNTTISKHDFYKVIIGPNHEISKNFIFYNETIRYIFIDNYQTYQKYGTVNVTLEECRSCLGKNCLNDGENCTVNSECGGAYCIRGRCNSAPICYNLDCICLPSEIQCSDNATCVLKNSMPLGAEPICSSLECDSVYVDPKTGLCAKTPAMLRAEEDERLRLQEAQSIESQETEATRNNLLLVFVLAFLIFGTVAVVFLYLKEKRRIAEEKTKQEQEKTKQISSELEKMKIQAYDMAQQLKREGLLESQKIEMEKRIAELRKSIEQTELELRGVESKAIEAANKPIFFHNLTQKPIYIAPDGYLYFKNSEPYGESFHRWVARTYIYNRHKSFYYEHYRNIPFGSLEVHHIDNDKRNPQPENLIILTAKEHKSIDSKSYTLGNRAVGLQRLKDLKIKAPHIPDLK